MQTTREHILNILKEQGQATVGSLSQALGLTAVTVRHHLDILRGEGLVAAPIAHRRKTPGRPQYVYTLTEKASSFFPKRYEHLANLILDELHTCLSPAKVNQLMERIGERIASQAPPLTKGSDFETRLIAAIEFLDKLGYMAHWERRDDDYLFHIVNCPYEKVSSHDQDICDVDLSLLTHLLGTPPQRVSWSAQGDSKCTYVVRAPDA